MNAVCLSLLLLPRYLARCLCERSTPRGSPERALFEQPEVQAFVTWLEEEDEEDSDGEEDSEEESTEEED